MHLLVSAIFAIHCEVLRFLRITAILPQFIPITLVIWVISLCGRLLLQNFPELLCAIFPKSKELCRMLQLHHMSIIVVFTTAIRKNPPYHNPGQLLMAVFAVSLRKTPLIGDSAASLSLKVVLP